MKNINTKNIIKNTLLKNNLLLEGDNLDSLNYLKTDYSDKIKLIYIDPPYNTHNKKFVYNDSLESSEWKKFMEKRLLLAKDLLHNEGLIFLSIDDNELFNLKLLCDEVFGAINFIANFIWVKNSTKNNSKTVSTVHEYILCYAKNKEDIKDKNYFKIKKPGYDEIMSLISANKSKKPSELEIELKKIYNKNKLWKGISSYKYVDENYEVYSSGDLSSPQKGYVYEIIHPITKKKCTMPKNGWRYKEEEMNKLIKNNQILFGETENKVPRFKRFLKDVETEVLKTIIVDNLDGKKELIKLFGKAPFNNPKPTSLIKTLISVIPDKDSIVLDFFAGSGTTGHAIIDLNNEDKGTRQFILCTNNENNICEEITYKRFVILSKENEFNLEYYKEEKE